MSYTIVVPCYNEQDNILLLYERICNVLKNSVNFVILFVNDGSNDGTLDRIKTLHAEDPIHVRYISLLKNCGHQKALFAGLCACKTSHAITMDADLQHPPEYIPDMISLQHDTDAPIITCKRKGHQKGVVKNISSHFFYRFFSRATGIPIEPGMSDFRLYNRRALDIISSLKEREPFLRGIIPKLGFKSRVIEYSLEERSQGVPAFTFNKSFKMGIRALLRFSKAPERIGLYAGIAGIVISLSEAIHYIYLRLFTNQLVPGQADLMVLLGLLGSMILLQLSLLLRTAMQMMDEIQAQPIYIIEESQLDDQTCH